MVPCRAERCRRYAGCPRLRGDGPPCGTSATISSWVSPPTRGWSIMIASLVILLAGVPAYAGMVLEVQCQMGVVAWCPRLRGDGPASGGMPRLHREVSPPTRGWSVPRVEVTSFDLGVPAYAGMVLCIPATTSGRGRCPRLRGDGPQPLPLQRARIIVGVSPPTRGWSRRVGIYARLLPGVPAYAGMVPSHQSGLSAAWRCPRLRGDGPVSNTGGGSGFPVSPPTRGWSAEADRTPAIDTGLARR